MLKEILSSCTCAVCKNCCVFLPQSAWELPTFCEASVRRLAESHPHLQITPTEDGRRYRIALPYDASGKAQPCPFLNAETGCTLPAEEKPFACSLWPVRVMEQAGTQLLTLYRGCDGLPEENAEQVKALLNDGLRERILAEAAADPTLILPYHENYLILEEGR